MALYGQAPLEANKYAALTAYLPEIAYPWALAAYRTTKSDAKSGLAAGFGGCERMPTKLLVRHVKA